MDYSKTLEIIFALKRIDCGWNAAREINLFDRRQFAAKDSLTFRMMCVVRLMVFAGDFLLTFYRLFHLRFTFMCSTFLFGHFVRSCTLLFVAFLFSFSFELRLLRHDFVSGNRRYLPKTIGARRIFCWCVKLLIIRFMESFHLFSRAVFDSHAHEKKKGMQAQTVEFEFLFSVFTHASSLHSCSSSNNNKY